MKHLKNKTKSILSLCIVVILILGFCQTTFAASPLEVYALDTVAGVSTRIQTSKTTPNSAIDFELKKPDGKIIKFDGMSNANGVAYGQISDYHTRKAGDYYVRAKLNSMDDFSGFSSFEVFPSSVSTSVSKLYPANQMVHVGKDTALISVKLVDDYANPIKGHMVKLLSSDNESDIEYYSSNITNAEGLIVFRVRSDVKGPVTYTAYDVSADTIISDRAKIGFYDGSNLDFEYAASGAPSGIASGLKFEDIPEEIGTGEIINFTLTAVDDDEAVVNDYLGTVRFSVLSDNESYVTLPEDYEFNESDLGSHTFSLTLSFLQPGEYQIEARDLDDPSIFGEYTFTVEDLFPEGSSRESEIEIENPVSGTYSNNIVVISGLAPASSELNIYDNEVKLDTVVVDGDGEFLYTSPALVDGEHALYLTIEDSEGTIIDESDIVNFIIDTSAPEITEISFEPEGDIESGEEITITLTIPDDLSQAAMIFNDSIYDLTRDSDGFYKATFSAPSEPGEYSFDFILLDELGNESRFSSEATINVIEKQVVEPEIGAVANLTATPDDEKIILNWAEPVIHENPISNYRIYFGLDPESLNNVVDTFTNDTTWYIPNLVNGDEYYFAVIAVDELGFQGKELSNVVKGIPAPPVVETTPPEVEAGIAGSEELMEMDEDKSESGPGVTLLLIFSVIAGYIYSNYSRFVLMKEKVKNSVSKLVR
ncbi:hypothetical protein GF354_02045 [Candidatus Peregrinibacteria bacterium]|nr:hypothetical protein [Candidatus Peregrinibacteria bacterium]